MSRGPYAAGIIIGLGQPLRLPELELTGCRMCRKIDSRWVNEVGALTRADKGSTDWLSCKGVDNTGRLSACLGWFAKCHPRVGLSLNWLQVTSSLRTQYWRTIPCSTVYSLHTPTIQTSDFNISIRGWVFMCHLEIFSSSSVYVMNMGVEGSTNTLIPGYKCKVIRVFGSIKYTNLTQK